MDVQQIIISHYRQNKSQRKIALELGINRRTVKKYIDLYNGKEKTGVTQVPKYKSTNRKKIKLTDQVKQIIDNFLESNAKKQTQGLGKQKLKKIDIFEALQDQGFDIGYTSVCNYIRSKKRSASEKFIKQHYQPGELSEFDWGTVKLYIKGKLVKFKIAIFTLAYSNHRFAMLFSNEKMNSFLEAHVHYFNHIKGVPKCFLYDNMKTAVAKFTKKQKDKVATNDLLKISTYYAFDFRFTGAAKGNEKGHVEKSVEYIRRKCFATKMHFNSLQDANNHLYKKVKLLNQKNAAGNKKSIQQNFKEEQEYFKNLPITSYEPAISQTCKINKLSTICISSNHYSVPESCNQLEVEARIYSDKINVYSAQNELIASHIRCNSKNQWIINLEHYLFTLKTKPGALACSYALKQSPQNLQKLFYNHYKNIPKTFIETAIFCKQNNCNIDHWIKAVKQYCSKTNNEITLESISFCIKQMLEKDNEIKVKSNISLLHKQIEIEAQNQLRAAQNLFN